MNRKRPICQFVFETLEPRLLLSGDLSPIPALQGHDKPHTGMDLTVTVDAEHHAIVVIDNTRNTVIDRYKIDGHGTIALNGTKNSDRFTIALDPAEVDFNRIQVKGGKGNDTLLGPSEDATWTLDKAGKGYLDNVAFQGIEKLVGSATGQDTLVGQKRGATWTVDGEGDGTVLETAFTGIDHLVGGDRGPDTLIVHPLGGSGAAGIALNQGHFSFDGGMDLDDRLIIEGNNLQDVKLTRSEKHGGVTEVDGLTIEHSQLEHLQLKALDSTQDVAANVTWTAQANDAVTLGDDTSDHTQIIVKGNDSHDDTTIAKPSASLTINGPGFSSTITLDSLTLPGTDLSVTAGQTSPISEPLLSDPTNQIIVDANAVITTSLSGGVAGNISIAAPNINVQSGAQLLAQGTSGGNVTLAATNLRYASGLILDAVNDVTAREASITITDATITTTGTVTIQAQAGDVSLEGSMNNYLDGWGGGALTDLEQLTSLIDTLPISVLYKNSSADISLTNTQITTSVGDVVIDANAQSEATGTGIFWASPGTSTSAAGGLAFVFVESDAKATIDIGHNTGINATGDVSITTEATTSATGTARVSQNTGRGNSPTNPQNVQAAVAIGITKLTSTITTDEDSLINSQTGTTTIAATGNNTNAPGAETESYKDGLAGLMLGLALSDNNVKVTALGEVEAGGTTVVADLDPTFSPFNSVDPVNHTIAVDNTAGYQTGDAITYSAGGGGAMPGLKDGQTYYVVVVDGTHFKLADSRSDALSGATINFGALPSLQSSTGEVRRFAQIQESTNQIVFDYNPGLVVGQVVTFNDVTDYYIGGLSMKPVGTTYTISSVAQSASGNQWLVGLNDATRNPVTLNLDPILIDSTDTSYAFHLNGSAIVFDQPQPSLTTGTPVIYIQALGLDIPTLTPDLTYVLVKDPTDTTNTVFRLAATTADATSSDGYSNTVALGKVDTSVTSGNSHQLTANNPGGIAITATLNTTEAAVTKSGQGGEPETSDLFGKGEMLPFVGTMLSNIKNLATGPVDQDGNLTNKMDDKIKDNANGSDSNTNFGVAATVAFVKSTNNAIVEVSNVIRSQSNLTIDAQINHSIQTQAEGVKSPSQDGTTTLTIAGAAAVGLSYDNAQVIVDGGTAIDVMGTFTAEATVTYPFLAPLDSPEDFGEYILNQFKANPLSTISGFLGNFFLLKQDLVNSWARAVDNDPKADISIAGAVDFQSRSTFATVDIMGGAQINQMASYHNPNQRVVLNAETDMKMINVGGIFDYDMSPEGLIKAARMGPTNALQPFGAQGGKAGFGGAYRQLDLNTTTHAIIHGADVVSGTKTAVTAGSAGGIEIIADNEVFVLGVTQSGTKAQKFGISGSAAISEQNTNTVAAIESGAVIRSSTLSLLADDHTVLPTFAGDIVKGGNLGVGVGLVYNSIDRTTLAYIGDAAGASTVGSDINVDSISLSATNAGDFIGFALAGAEAGTEPSTPSSQPTNLNSQVGQSGANVPSGSNGAGNYGVAISADVVFIKVDDTALSFIDDAGKLEASRVNLIAENETKYIAGAGSVAIAKSDGTSVGLAGSYSEVDLSGATETYINRSQLTVGTGDLEMAATWAGLASAAAAGGSGAPRQGGIATSGSVAVNRLAQSTAATVGGGASLNVAGQVTVTATDELQALAIAGSADYGGRAGIGAAGALNISTERVAVGIQNSTFNQSAGDSYWTASFADPGANTPRLVAVAGAVALSKGVAADGIVALNSLANPTNDVGLRAYLNASTYTSGPASLVLTAQNDQTMIAVGAAIAGGTKVAIGAGAAANVSTMSIISEVTDSALHLWGLQLNATRGGQIEAVAVGAALSQDTASIAGSAAVNVIGETVDAHIQDTVAPANDSYVALGASVTSSATTDITAAAGALSINTNGAAAIGAALAFNQITNHSYASIGGAHLQVGTGVTSGSATSVSANMGGTVQAIAVGAEGGQTLAAGGSVAVTETNTDLGAAIESGARLTTHGSVAVSARGTMTFDTVAGQVAGALDGAAVGLANTTLDRKDTTKAYIDDAFVSVLGTAGQASVSVGDQGAKSDSVGFSGLSVTSVSVDTILGVTAGASAAADASVAGSATLTLLDKTTQAQITNTADLSGATIANLNMLAYDETVSRTGAGALAGAEYAGIGAGADVSKLTKIVDALFDAPQTTIAGNAVIVALAKEDLLSTAAVASGAIGALAGANSTYLFDLQTSALIGDNGTGIHLTTAGSILLAADNQTSVNQILGALEGGGISVGASAAVVDYTRKDVTASIENSADIHTQAAATSTAINAATGAYTVGYTDPDNQAGEVQPPDTTVDLDKLTGNSEGHLGHLDAPGLTRMRNASANYEAMRGLAITATGQDSVRSYTFAAGGGGDAIELAANVVVAKTNVSASIGNGVGVNNTTPNPGFNQSVLVTAGQDFSRLGVNGGLAGGVVGAGTAGADVTLLTLNTTAEIDNSAVVNAASTVIVSANTNEDILAITAGFGGSGFTALDAGAVVIHIQNTTRAGIGAASVRGDSVGIYANDTTTIAGIAGEVAIGGAGGVGAGVVVTMIDKATTAEIGGGASVITFGNIFPNTIRALDGTSSIGPDSLNTKQIHGVAVQATSSELVTAIGASGAGGVIGLAGGVTVTSIASNTQALIDSGAQINPGALSSNPLQGVSVAAGNLVQVLDIAGAIGIGAAGVAGGVDTGFIRNGTNAQIGAATINAGGDVDVFSLELADVDSYALSIGAGVVGVAGAVSDWTIGTDFSSTYSDTGNSDNALSIHGSGAQYGSSDTYSDGQTNRSDIKSLLGHYSASSGSNNTGAVNGVVSQALTDYSGSQPQGEIHATYVDTKQSTNYALIDSGAVFATGGDFNLKGDFTLKLHQAPGTGALGLGGAVGGSVAIAEVGQAVNVQYWGAATIGGSMNVEADYTADPSLIAFGGAAGWFVGIGAQVAVYHDSTQVLAQLSDGSSAKADSFSVTANSDLSTASVTAEGVSSGAAAVGAAVAEFGYTGTTQAIVGNVTLTEPGGPTGIADVTISATTTVKPTVSADAVAAGIGAGAGNLTRVDLAPTTSALLVDGGNIHVSGSFTLGATSDVNANSSGEGLSAGGIVAAVSFVEASINDTVIASIGSGYTVSAGSIEVTANAADTVTASGTANAGVSLLGGTGVETHATLSSTVSAEVGGAASLTATNGNITVEALATTAGSSTARGVNSDGLLAIGVSKAYADITPTVTAYIDATRPVTATGSVLVHAYLNNGGAQAITVSANGSEGALPLDVSESATAAMTSTPTVTAFIGDPGGADTANTTAVTAGTNGAINVIAWAQQNDSVTAENTGNGFFNADGDASANFTRNLNVNAYVGSGVHLTAGAAFIQANTTFDSLELSAQAGSGGIAATGNTYATAISTGGATIDIGAGAIVNAGVITLLNEVQIPYSKIASGYSGDGVYGQPEPTSRFNLGYDANNNQVGGGPTINVAGTLNGNLINITALSQSTLGTTATASMSGVGGPLTAKAIVLADQTASINLNSGAVITAPTISLQAIGINVSSTYAECYANALGTNKDYTSTIDIYGGATIDRQSGVSISPGFSHTANNSGNSLDFEWHSGGNSAHSDNPTDHGNDNTTASDNSANTSLARGIEIDSAKADSSAPSRVDPSTGWLILGVQHDDHDERDDWLELREDFVALDARTLPRIDWMHRDHGMRHVQ